jgi:eukaryotic-like serine/threonine-protein kinase
MATMVKAGRYEILSELGRGAMGVVYRATDPVIGRSVAVKTIRLSEEGTGLSKPEMLTRFQTEARAAGLLTHPNIVVVYDAGEENGLYFITMELVEGKSLQALIDGGHAFPVSRVLRILEQTCSALQFAHDRNVVHRDIKPANLMLTADDTVKVTDFGTAKILQFGTVQQTTHVMGTPSYMSPEQVKGRAVDGRSDIFSLGVVLYEMLTGEKPFPGQSITTVIYKIVNEDPIPPRQLNPSVHPGLNEIVLRALSKEPETRYQSCREMLDDLRNYRAMGGSERNPDATMISPAISSSRTSTAGTVALGIGNGSHFEDPATAATIRSLQNRASSPGQTPVVRRTGSLQPLQVPEKKKSNTFATVLAAIFLLCVIVYGGMKLRPEFQAARQRDRVSNAENVKQAAPEVSVGEKSANATSSGETVASTPPPPDTDKPTAPAVIDSQAKTTDTLATVAPAIVLPAKKAETSLNPATADYKKQIDALIADKGFKGRVSVGGSGNTLMLNGRLRPAEHAALLHLMRSAPPSVHVVDDILYDDAPVASSEKGDNGGHPVPSADKSAIHVLTDVVGASATAFDSNGRSVGKCQTPCSLNDLVPARYSLQIQKDGYSPLQTAVEVKSGQAHDLKLHLEAIQRGLSVSSQPPGADIFINGSKQSGQTPALLPLAPGAYDIVLRIPGYQAYSNHVQVKDGIQTTLDVKLNEKAQGKVAWAEVKTVPSGAEILVDGTSSEQTSPARVQIPAGNHTITLKLKGFQPGVRHFLASEGSTVDVSETLKPRQSQQP